MKESFPRGVFLLVLAAFLIETGVMIWGFLGAKDLVEVEISGTQVAFEAAERAVNRQMAGELTSGKSVRGALIGYLSNQAAVSDQRQKASMSQIRRQIEGLATNFQLVMVSALGGIFGSMAALLELSRRLEWQRW